MSSGATEFSTELDIHDACPVAGSQCWLLAADTVGLLLGVLTMASPAIQSFKTEHQLKRRSYTPF